jgi:hypothetical protein
MTDQSLPPQFVDDPVMIQSPGTARTSPVPPVVRPTERALSLWASIDHYHGYSGYIWGDYGVQYHLRLE